MQSKAYNLNTIISRVICTTYIINIGKYIVLDHYRHHQVLLSWLSDNLTFGTLD